MTKISLYNVQRAVTPLIGKPKLKSKCSSCFMVFYICEKIPENISNGLKLPNRQDKVCTIDIAIYNVKGSINKLQCLFQIVRYTVLPVFVMFLGKVTQI